MPITINDCTLCRELPEWGYDEMGGGFADLLLFCRCDKGAWVRGITLDDTAKGWNDANPSNSMGKKGGRNEKKA